MNENYKSSHCVAYTFGFFPTKQKTFEGRSLVRGLWYSTVIGELLSKGGQDLYIDFAEISLKHSAAVVKHGVTWRPRKSWLSF